METIQKPFDSQEKNDRIHGTIQDFFDNFHIGSRLNRCSIRKVRGARPLVIITALFSLPFQGVNLYRGIVRNREPGFLKDAGYDVLKRPNFNWRAFLLSLSVAVIRFLNHGSEARRTIPALSMTSSIRPRTP